MTKDEFETITGMKVHDEEYRIIEMVYTYHPLIPETTGKKRIADLYILGGMALIRDMLPTAKKAMELEVIRQQIREQIWALREEEEKALKEFRDWYEKRS